MLIYFQMIESDEDKEKFEQIYLEYYGLMFYVAGKCLENKEDREDAVHQAFLTIIENLNRIGEIHSSRTRAFVTIITENKAIDILRARRYMANVSCNEAEMGIEVEFPSDGSLAAAFSVLDVKQREALLLHYAQGFSIREVGKMMGVSYGAMRKYMWRAKRRLQKCLEESGELL